MANAHADHHGHHIVPLKLLWGVFGALVFLTIFTVITAHYVDIGPLNLPLAIAIAVTKATLVVTFFMALRWDNRVNLLIFSLGFIFVIVFLTFTLFDTSFRGDMSNSESNYISDQERIEQQLQERQERLEQGLPLDVVEEEPVEAGHGDDHGGDDH